MARFKLVNILIKVVKKEGSLNNGKEYLIADMINLNCPRSTSPRYTSFYGPYIDQVKPFLSTAAGGTGTTTTELPAELGIVTGTFVPYKPVQQFYKKHLTANPEKGYKIGDLVTLDGKPRIYDTLIVFCEYYMDEFGEKTWLTGNSPEQAGEQAFGNYCVPVTISSAPVLPSTAAPETVDSSVPEVGTTPPPPGYMWKEINGMTVPVPIGS